MDLQGAIVKIATDFGLNADRMLSYSTEFKSVGSLDGGGLDSTAYTVDGKLLYTMIRELKPERVLESGTNNGGSANHILAALSKNGGGTLITVDIAEGAEGYIQAPSRTIVEIVTMDICEYVKEAAGFDFIHEDASHEIHTVNAVYSHLPTLLPEGGFIMSHDIGTGVKDWIRAGIKNAHLPPANEYVYDGSPCGYAIYRHEN